MSDKMMRGSRENLMSEDKFWEIIELSKADDPQDQLDNLVEQLSAMTADDIFGFDYQLDKHLEMSYNSDLWAAAYIVCGGCSDDAFDYFRAWLVSKGRDVFEKALENPDSLLDVFEAMDDADFPENEEILYATLDAYDEATGKEDFYDVLDTFEDNFQIVEIELTWDEDDPKTLAAVCPNLFERYYDDPL
ncbi:hypothetical protein MmiEs2_03420 [Methanimicrococcus stummii]|uniref:DUF4240 domain-containing protein n=1 Tax=Methanimicrococcus stummii TaxID=3028294 RepID=A0AA96ZWP7_9EURY|nr:DUF4240 domain-containing protein [Methanimicrococcus sp. Es2]WNY28160.1 hypothetical protein MmiEs2_03420 [Methanimicrococcus sp. Es2]